MLKLFPLGLLLCLLAGCGSGMPQAYSVLPNTFDDLARKSQEFHGGTPAKQTPQKPAATGTPTSG